MSMCPCHVVPWIGKGGCDTSARELKECLEEVSYTITQRVHVGLWYIFKAQRGSHVPTLRPKYLPYSYMDPLGKISPSLTFEGHANSLSCVHTVTRGSCVVGFFGIPIAKSCLLPF